MTIQLPLIAIEAGTLLQHVSRIAYKGGSLYYGRDGANRYDDPAQAYGVLYMGLDLSTSLMESVFHKHLWLADPKRSIALGEVRSRMVRAVGVVEGLHLADLTATGVMAGYFGLNLEQLASRDYAQTQRISSQVHALLEDDGRPLFDGLLYPSRNNYPAASIALFDRAETKVVVVDDIDLVDHVDWSPFVERYRIGVEPDPGLVETDDEAS